MDVISYLLGKKNSSSGGNVDLSEYFAPTISSGTVNSGGYADMIKKIPDNTVVSGTDLSYAFRNYLGTSIPLLDTSNVTNVNSMFSNAINLKAIPLIFSSSRLPTTFKASPDFNVPDTTLT